MSPSSFRDLIVWRKGMDLLLLAHEIAARLPADLRETIAPDLRATAITIPARIARGHGLDELRGYIRSLDAAHGKVFQLATLLDVSVALGAFPSDDPALVRARELCTEIARMLDTLMSSLRVRESGMRDES